MTYFFRIYYILLVLNLNNTLHGEAFGNTAISFPVSGLSILDPINFSQKKWEIDYQYLLGAKVSFAIDYNWWWFTHTLIGAGKLKDTEVLFSINAGSGLKFCKAQDNFRPYASTSLDYLQFLKKDFFNLTYPIWLGPKFSLGLEWIFYDEMSFSIQTDYALLINIKYPFRNLVNVIAELTLYL